jgi:hypothetical protein
VDVPVHDISEEGARIGVAENLKVNDVIAVTFAGMNAIAGKIVRDGGDSFGVWFTPSRLRPEELRDLVTTPQRAV